MINGVLVKSKGVIRPENWPDTGHYVSVDRMVRDLELLKQVNTNHVQTLHHTDDPRWCELADEERIYLAAVANVECYGYMSVLDREPRYEKSIVDRNVADVEDMKNHPSIGSDHRYGPMTHYSETRTAGTTPTRRQAFRKIAN